MKRLLTLASAVGIPISGTGAGVSNSKAVADIPFNPKAMLAIKVLGWVVIAGIAIVVLGAPTNSSIAVIISLAITGVSAIVGFLFGIPRTDRADGTANTGSKPGATATSTPASSTSHNASLEQVADWLTKLLLGAGLTQLSEMKRGVLRLSEVIANCVTPLGPTGIDSAAGVFGLGVVGFFSACGFLGGYLSTRLLLARLLIEEDQNVRELMRKEGWQQGLDQTILEMNRRNITRQRDDSLIKGNVSMREAVIEAENWAPAIEPRVSDDPQKGRFGEIPERDGKKLSATVTPVSEEDGELFEIVLKVESLDTKEKLTQPVKFFLHDTFDPDTVIVLPSDGVATLELTAYGAFTVGAMTDGGNTKLEIDLATLPGVPRKFASR